MKADNRKYLSVGIDVGADFSLMAIALPSQELVGKSYRIFHNSKRSLDGAIDLIYSVMEQYDLPARIFMESTIPQDERGRAGCLRLESTGYSRQ